MPHFFGGPEMSNYLFIIPFLSIPLLTAFSAPAPIQANVMSPSEGSPAASIQLNYENDESPWTHINYGVYYKVTGGNKPFSIGAYQHTKSDGPLFQLHYLFPKTNIGNSNIKGTLIVKMSKDNPNDYCEYVITMAPVYNPVNHQYQEFKLTQVKKVHSIGIVCRYNYGFKFIIGLK